MTLRIDMHTHSIASGHAFSTIEEMAVYAKKNDIEMFAITDHGPNMPGSAPWLYFEHLTLLPNEIEGVRVLKGIEANIVDYTGKIDLENKVLKKLDIVIASLHDICLPPSTVDAHTDVMIKAIENPYVDIIGHPGNLMFQIDIEKVVKAAKENSKVIEINDHSFSARPGCYDNCKRIALMCKEYGVTVTCSSDAHIKYSIGNLDKAINLLSEIEMPEEHILNSSIGKVEKYLLSRKDRLANI